MGSKSSPPPAPNYAAAAQATAQGNLQAAQQAQAANMINQITPYGNLTYSQNPASQNINGYQTYTATQTLTPAQQQMLDLSNQLSTGLLGTAQQGLNYANQTLSQPGVDLSKLPSTGINPGQSYQQAMMTQLQPQIDRQQQMLNTQLQNQGIPIGSDAWKAAQQQQAQNTNNLLAQATTQGMGMGLNANQQAFQQQAYNQMQPINVINALRTGTQVAAPNYVNTPQQATTQGADLLGAANAQYQNQLQSYNAQQANAANMMGGLMNLGGAAMMAPAGTFTGAGGLLTLSDIRLKKNIKRIGTHELGIGIYSYEYVWGEPAIGVMAQEVLAVKPSAVAMTDSGYLAVDYGRL